MEHSANYIIPPCCHPSVICRSFKPQVFNHYILKVYVVNKSILYLCICRRWHYRDSSCLYMLFDYVCGGELFSYLRNAGRFNTSTGVICLILTIFSKFLSQFIHFCSLHSVKIIRFLSSFNYDEENTRFTCNAFKRCH